jgi:putative hemolysin
LLQLILILINAFFAASEIAVVSLNPNKLRKEAEEGDKKAQKLLKLVEEPTSFLSAIQIGITFAGFLGSAFAAENFSDRLVKWLVEDRGFSALPAETIDTLSVVVITIILSFFTLVLGELVPKRLAMHSPMKVAKFTSPVVRGVAVVMKPVIWLLKISTAGMLRVFGIKDKKKEEKVTEDEIRLMVDIGEETGTIDAKEGEIIDNVFEFGNNTAKKVMTRFADVVSLDVNTASEEAVKIISDCGFSRIPVYEEKPENIIGVLLVREYLIALRSCREVPIREYMRPPYFVPGTVTCDSLFFEMQKNQNHMAFVIGEYGEFIGIVTMEDLIEEILGNIYDESDDARVDDGQIVKIGENSWRIAGNAELDNVSELLGIEIPEDIEANTFSGLAMSCLTEIPDDGSVFEVDCCGLHIKVTSFIERRVESAEVSVIKDAEVPEVCE